MNDTIHFIQNHFSIQGNLVSLFGGKKKEQERKNSFNKYVLELVVGEA